MNRQQLLDLYYLEARAKLIDLAAFLDRLDRAPGEGISGSPRSTRPWDNCSRSKPPARNGS